MIDNTLDRDGYAALRPWRLCGARKKQAELLKRSVRCLWPQRTCLRLRHIMNDADFLNEVERAITLYEQVIRHYASRTRAMVDRHGAVGALSRLVVSPDLQQGFKALRDLGRLDMSFEAIVVRYPHLFQQDAIDAAQWRLNNPHALL